MGCLHYVEENNPVRSRCKAFGEFNGQSLE